MSEIQEKQEKHIFKVIDNKIYCYVYDHDKKEVIYQGMKGNCNGLRTMYWYPKSVLMVMEYMTDDGWATVEVNSTGNDNLVLESKTEVSIAMSNYPLDNTSWDEISNENCYIRRVIALPGSRPFTVNEGDALFFSFKPSPTADKVSSVLNNF